VGLSQHIKRVSGQAKKYFGNGCTELTVTTGKYKLLVPNDMVWAFSGGDYYEHNVIHFLDKIVKNYQNPVMLDVGANCGYYSIRYFAFCKQIFSFEPVSKIYRILKTNIKINSITNIVALNCGLADKQGEHTINLYNSSGNNSIFDRKVPEEHSLKKIGEEIIRLNTLDELIASGTVAAPDIIKIDVEGSELNVLKGAEKTINQYRPTILFEYAETTANDAGYSKVLLLTVLNLSNYTIYGIAEDENDFNLVEKKDLDKYPVANLIFVPAEKDFFINGNS
jgi:FkbM family methyltransferase